MPDPTKPVPSKVIGLRTKFTGGSGEHSYLKGHGVVIIGVIRGALVVTPGVDYEYVGDNDALAAVGGLDLDADRLDVAPVVPDPAVPEGERPSFASSDVRPSDLDAFAPVAVPVETPPVVERTPEDYERLRLVRQLEGTLARTGRSYRIALDRLDAGSLREVIRLLRDQDGDKVSALRRARMEPWRR